MTYITEEIVKGEHKWVSLCYYSGKGGVGTRHRQYRYITGYAGLRVVLVMLISGAQPGCGHGLENGLFMTWLMWLMAGAGCEH